MRLVMAGIFVTGLAGMAQAATAQGSWQPQASPSPAPPPVYYSPPTYSPAPPPPPGKQRPARPAGDPGRWVTNDDYPAEAVKNKQQGTTGFRLTIDPSGNIVGCEITSSSGFASLDETTCRVMTQRARFSPALDKKGKPITGTWASRFRWVLQDDDLPPIPAPFLDSISFIVETDGSTSSCIGTGRYADMGGSGGLCAKNARSQPYRDPAGNPVRRRVTMSASLVVEDPDTPPPVAAPPPKPPVQTKPRKQP